MTYLWWALMGLVAAAAAGVRYMASRTPETRWQWVTVDCGAGAR